MEIEGLGVSISSVAEPIERHLDDVGLGDTPLEQVILEQVEYQKRLAAAPDARNDLDLIRPHSRDELLHVAGTMYDHGNSI